MAKAKEKGGKKAERDSKGHFTKGNDEGSKIQKGEVRNPNGRRNSISDTLRQILDEDDGAIRKELSAKLVKEARGAKGNAFLNAFDRITDRTEGKPTQPTADVSDGWQKFLDGVLEAE